MISINKSNYVKTDFIPIIPKHFPGKPSKHNELRQLKKYSIVQTISLKSLPVSIKFCEQIPTLLSGFSESEFFIYDFISKKLQTSVNKLNGKISFGTIRADGKAILAGSDLGEISIYGIESKNIIRKYAAHSQEISSIDIDSSLVTFTSSSKDCSFKVFDMTVLTPKYQFLNAHDDYIQVTKYKENNIILTGGYDKLIKLWDINQNKNSLIFENGKICEDILILKDKNYFLSTADNGISLFDIRYPKAKVKELFPVQSTIKKLISNESNQRLFISAPNESFIKVLNMKNYEFNFLYSLNLSTKLNAFDISKDMNYFAFSNPNNEIILKTKNMPLNQIDESKALDYDKERKDLELLNPENYAEKIIVKNYKYFNRGQYSKEINPTKNQILLPKLIKKQLQSFDHCLKQFKYKDSLDEALKIKNVEYILSIIEELIDRNALKIALMNRSEDELEIVLNFILWKINDIKASSLCEYVMNIILDLYSSLLSKSMKLKELFKKIQKEIGAEIEFMLEINNIKDNICAITEAYKCLEK